MLLRVTEKYMRPEDRYDSLFQFYGWKSAVDWLLLKAQVKAESDFAPRAKSPAGAKGLSQFMPATFEEWAQKLKLSNPDIYNPEHSIQCQAAYMDWLLTQCAGNQSKALAAYNWGIGNIARIVAEQGDAWAAHLPEETQNYLARVETYYDRYRKEHGGAIRAA